MRSLSRIVKSSYVRLGDKIEIQAQMPFSEVEEEEQGVNEENDVDEPSFEEICKNKIQEAENEIQMRLQAADEEAKQIIAEAYDNAKEIYKNAREDGYQAGIAEGYQAGKKEADVLIDEALSIKEEVKESKKRMVQSLEADIVQLIIDTTEKIMNIKIEDTQETIIGLIKLGLEKCTYTESLIVRVSPMDYEYVMSAKKRILSLAENIDDIQIKQDAALGKGSCIIDTLSGSIDSGIETQFKQIKELFKELLESES